MYDARVLDDLAHLVNPDCPGCRALLDIVEAQAHIQLEQAKQIEAQARQLQELTGRLGQLEEKLGEGVGIGESARPGVEVAEKLTAEALGGSWAGTPEDM